jgi:hypothetical protein
MWRSYSYLVLIAIDNGPENQKINRTPELTYASDGRI